MWWFFRSKTRDPDGKGVEANPPDTAPRHSFEGRLLDLQRSVGNQAVQRMVSDQGPTTGTPEVPVAHLPTTTGELMDPETQAFMESRFDTDFSDVRVHTDTQAAASAESLQANAYTSGRDIYFARGMYAPRGPEGLRLLGHELTHVIQQDGTTGNRAASNELIDRTDPAEREAEEVAGVLGRGECAPAILSAGKGIQRDVGWAQRGPLPDPYGTLLLLNAFAAKFLDAAKLIYQNSAAMKLVNEAEAAGIQFGGYAEDGPGKAIGRAYTSGNAVYVPRAQTDPVMAMRDFLFELNNALRAPKFAELTKEATKGTKGSLTAKSYAYKMAEQEVEGVLRLGEVWFETKKAGGKGGVPDKYDLPFFLADYQAVHDGKKSKDDVVKEVLKRVYDTGTLKGKTVEQYYTEVYESLAGSK